MVVLTTFWMLEPDSLRTASRLTMHCFVFSAMEPSMKVPSGVRGI